MEWTDDKSKKKKKGGTLRLLFGKKDSGKGRKIKVTKKGRKGKSSRERKSKNESSESSSSRKKEAKERRGRDRRSRVEEEEEDEGEDEEEKKRKMAYREKRELRKKRRMEEEKSAENEEKRRADNWKKAKASRRRSASVSMGNLPNNLRNRYGTLGGTRSDGSIRKGGPGGDDDDSGEKSEEGDSNWKGFFSPEVKKAKRKRAQSVSRARPSLNRQDSQGLFGTLKESIFGRSKSHKTPKGKKGRNKGDPMFLSPSKPIDNWDGYEIHEVCFGGDVMKLYDLVKKNRDLNASNEDMNTPLHFSCALGKTLCVKELLKHHDINTTLPNCKGDYPLHVASRNGHADIVKLMIKNGRFSMYETNRDGKSCIDLAKNSAVEEVFKTQVRAEEKFISAVMKKRFSVVKELLVDPGVNVNCTREYEVGPGIKKKRNALDILFSTKKLSDLDDDEDLIRLLVNRGCTVSQKISQYDSKYQELLNEGYVRGKRYNFLKEIIQTEKVYNDDLWITINLFADPLKDGASGSDKTSKIFKSIKKKEMQKKLARFWSTLEDIRKVALKNTIQLSKKFKTYSYLMQETEGAELAIRSEELAEAEAEYMACLEGIDLEPYIKFCYQQSFMEGWIRKKREYSEVYKFYRRQEQKIPLPRIRDGGFVSMLSKVRNRLFKYRGFLECVIKYTDQSKSDDFMEILRSVLKHIMDGLTKINKDAGDIENKKQMLSIHRLFKERYNIKMLVQNKNRKYICHETNFKAFDMVDLECHECDIYVFSDSVFFGSKKGGGFEFYWYNQKKICWTWHDDHYRLMIHKKREDGGEKILDYIVPCNYSYTWFKEMKEFFTQHHPTFYWNHIFLHSAFSFDKEIEEFRLLRSEEDEIKIHRRMMIKYKSKRRIAEEKAQRYMNKTIEKKKTIDMLRRERKKGGVGSPASPKDGGKGNSSDVIGRPKKVQLKIRVSFDKESPAEGSRKRRSAVHTPDEETPVKVAFPTDDVFNFGTGDASIGSKSCESTGSTEKKKKDPDENVFGSLESTHVRRLFSTPTQSEEQEED